MTTPLFLLSFLYSMNKKLRLVRNVHKKGQSNSEFGNRKIIHSKTEKDFCSLFHFRLSKIFSHSRN